MSKVVWFDISGTSAMGVINGRCVTIEARRGGPTGTLRFFGLQVTTEILCRFLI